MTSDERGTANRDDPHPVCEVPFGHEQPGLRVVEAVATASDVTPAQVTPRLSDIVEPDALERLFRSTSRGSDRQRTGRIRFEMGDWDVEVDWNAEQVRVYEAIDA